MMSGVKLVGRFTILGKEDAMPEEEYTIKRVKKLDAEDLWEFMPLRMPTMGTWTIAT